MSSYLVRGTALLWAFGNLIPLLAQEFPTTGPCHGDSTITYFGYTYDLVEIEGYCFFAENLKTHQFQNGDSINFVNSINGWQYMVYPWSDGNPGSEWDCMTYPDFSDSLFDVYGGLYNKFAASDPRNLCPSGFHIPHYSELLDAVNSAGGYDYVGGDFKTAGTIEAGTGLWHEPNTEATNSTGFAALPAGFAYGSYSTPFLQRGNIAYFCTLDIIANSLTDVTTSYTWSTAHQAQLYHNSNNFYIPYNNSAGDVGYSVRCVRNPAQIGCMDSLAIDFDPQANVSGPCNVPDCSDPAYANYGEVSSAQDGCFILSEGGPCMGQQSINYFGTDYPLVELAGSCWFAKNLDTDFFNDSTEIPLLITEAEWELAEGPGRCSYNFSDSLQEVYGQLYHGRSVTSDSELCPQGWVIPSRQEWEELRDSLNPIHPGGDLKATGSWVWGTGDWSFPNRFATNSTGFNALPGGQRYDGENFQKINETALFLSRTYQESCCGTTVFRMSLSDFGGDVGISDGNIDDLGASVRCAMRPGCTDSDACNYNPKATLDTGDCTYPDTGYDCFGNCVTALASNGYCYEELIYGCLDDSACNFDPLANQDDGSCIPCDVIAEYCGEGTHWDTEALQCIPDSAIMDTIIAPIPACGPGTYWHPIQEVCLVSIPADTDLDGCVAASDVLNLLAAFGTCPPIPFSSETSWECGDPVNYWDYAYETVLIGDQCWFGEDLKSRRYANGDDIPGNLYREGWSEADSTQTGAQTLYGLHDQYNECDVYSNILGTEVCDSVLNLMNFGRMYNGWAVLDSRSLCPSSWSVPTDGQWMDLETHIGMPESQLDLFTEYRGQDLNMSASLKNEIAPNYWPSDNWSGNGATLFDLRPGAGYRMSHGSYCCGHAQKSYWSSSLYYPVDPEESNRLFFRDITVNAGGIWRAAADKGLALSVRCIKD